MVECIGVTTPDSTIFGCSSTRASSVCWMQPTWNPSPISGIRSENCTWLPPSRRERRKKYACYVGWLICRLQVSSQTTARTCCHPPRKVKRMMTGEDGVHFPSSATLSRIVTLCSSSPRHGRNRSVLPWWTSCVQFSKTCLLPHCWALAFSKQNVSERKRRSVPVKVKLLFTRRNVNGLARWPRYVIDWLILIINRV